MLTDFQNSFADRLSVKFATKSCLIIPPHLKYVAALPCEISTFKNHNAQEVIDQIAIQKTILKYLSGNILII